MTIDHLSLEEFLAQLATKTPTPGGGSAASVMGAMGAALVSMVCNLTVGKNKDVAEATIRDCLTTAEKLRADLTATMAQDIEAFNQVIVAYGLARLTDDEKTVRASAIQSALTAATEVPLHCAQLCAEVLTLSREVAEIGNRNVISDAGIAAMAAYAGLKGAALNVYINVPNLRDREFAGRSLTQIEQLTAAAALKADEIYQLVRSRI